MIKREDVTIQREKGTRRCSSAFVSSTDVLIGKHRPRRVLTDLTCSGDLQQRMRRVFFVVSPIREIVVLVSFLFSSTSLLSSFWQSVADTRKVPDPYFL
jgi:hypothetical protein